MKLVRTAHVNLPWDGHPVKFVVGTPRRVPREKRLTATPLGPRDNRHRTPWLATATHRTPWIFPWDTAVSMGPHHLFPRASWGSRGTPHGSLTVFPCGLPWVVPWQPSQEHSNAHGVKMTDRSPLDDLL